MVATGPSTELGKIAGRLSETEEESTPLQRELEQVGKLRDRGDRHRGRGLADDPADRGDRSASGLIAVLLLAVSLAVAAVPGG